MSTKVPLLIQKLGFTRKVQKNKSPRTSPTKNQGSPTKNVEHGNVDIDPNNVKMVQENGIISSYIPDNVPDTNTEIDNLNLYNEEYEPDASSVLFPNFQGTSNLSNIENNPSLINTKNTAKNNENVNITNNQPLVMVPTASLRSAECKFSPPIKRHLLPEILLDNTGIDANNTLNFTQNTNANVNFIKSVPRNRTQTGGKITSPNSSLLNVEATRINILESSTQPNNNLSKPNEDQIHVNRNVRSPNDICVVGFPSNELQYVHRLFMLYGNIEESRSQNNILFIKYVDAESAKRAMQTNSFCSNSDNEQYTRWIKHDNLEYMIVIMHAEDVEHDKMCEFSSLSSSPPPTSAYNNSQYAVPENVRSNESPMMSAQDSFHSKFFQYFSNGW